MSEPRHDGEPGDADRIFPESVAERFDDFVATVLGGSDVDGVPVPYGFQQADKLKKWGARLEGEGLTEALLYDINAGIGEAEAKYPGSPMWDREREEIASMFFGAGHTATAMDFVCGMQSSHQMAETVMSLAERQAENNNDAEAGAALTFALTERLRTEYSDEKYLGFVRALADQTIDCDPEAMAIDIFEGRLAAHDPEFDAIQSWADSQQLLFPDFRWDDMVAYIKDDAYWEGVPINYRRYAMKSYVLMLRGLMADTTPAVSQQCLEVLEENEARYPGALAWDTCRYTLGVSLLERGYPASTQEFGCAIKDAQIQSALVSALLEKGHEDDAFILAINVRDPKLKATTLLGNGGWGGKGSDYLAEITQDEDGIYPVEERLACMEVVKEHYVAVGDEAEAAKWEERIARLQQQLPENRE